MLDTNSVLSALVFPRGRLATLRDAWQHRHCEPLVSNATVAELVRVLAYPKFKLDVGQQRELLADYVPYATAVAMPARPPKTPDCRDPFDMPFLQLAVAGKADALVSGDRDVLSMAGRMPCAVLSPAEFVRTLPEKPQG